MDFENLPPIEQIAIQKGVSVDSVLFALRRAIEKVLDHKIASDTITPEGNMVFISETGKKIRLSPLLQKRISKYLDEFLNSEMANQAKVDKVAIVEGTIIGKLRSGYRVMTKKYGEARAPYSLMVKCEKNLYQIGATLTFHVHKFGSSLTLDRRSREIVEYVFSNLMPPKIQVYRVNRAFGKQIKAYVSALPPKDVNDRLRMEFTEKKIDWIVYEN